MPPNASSLAYLRLSVPGWRLQTCFPPPSNGDVLVLVADGLRQWHSSCGLVGSHLAAQLSMWRMWVKLHRLSCWAGAGG